MVKVKEILNEMDDSENFFLVDISYFFYIIVYKHIFAILNYFCFIVITIAPTIPNNKITELIINHTE